VPETPTEAERTPRLELLIVTLLGIVSVATAWTSFQASLYGGMQSSAYSQAQNLQTEAESLYLEANQQYIRDAQTLDRLNELSIEIDSSDPAIAETASAKFDTLSFTSISDDLAAAIDWSNAENDANPAEYVSPLESPDYLMALYGAWDATDRQSLDFTDQGDEANERGDWLALWIAVMAITLFLLGIAAVLRGRRVKWVLIGFGTAIFVVAAIGAATVPIVWLA